jgi:(p)ppGpp synthase/HD superfamily hydrolase/type II secretory pathway predicted ATPase ExeA
MLAMPRKDPFARRIDKLRGAILKLGQGRLRGVVRRPGRSWQADYAREASESHHARLAATLLADYDDPVLAEAGFLHGVPARWMQALEFPLAEGVEAVLRDLDRLRAPRLEAEYSLRPKELMAEVLPGLPEPRAAFLLVAERLDRWDPTVGLRGWSQGFRSSACEPDPSLLRAIPKPGAEPKVSESASGRPGLAWATRQELSRLRDVAAPTAEFCGLWDDRNALEDLALLHSDRGRFRKAVAWAARCERDGICRGFTEVVEGALSSLDGESVAAWEWRHVASIDRNLDLGRSAEEKIGRLWRCGYITVVCPDAASCYRLLGEAHTRLSYQSGGLLDQVGKPTRAGYRALHTVVSAEVGGRQLAIAVRFVPRNSRDPDRLPSPRQLLEGRLKASEGRSEGIRVYTPAGAFRHLPAGATVLNFAATVHTSFVGLVDHAILNETQQVGVLHRLEDGDRVELVKGDVPRMPPSGWEDEVPSKTRKGLRRLLRASFSPVLEAEGRRRMRRAMAARGAPEVEDDVLLSDLLTIAAEIAEDNLGFKSRRSPDWWKEQLGLRAFAERGEELPFSPGMDELKLAALEDALAGLLDRLRYRTDEMDLPDAMKRGARGILKCPECRPMPGSQLAVTSEGGRVVVHDAEADCAEGGEQLGASATPTLQQYFVVETTNRHGVALDVLSVFHQARVDVVDIVGRRLGPRWAVVRVEADLVGPSRVRSLLFDLRKLDGVKRVRGPGQAPLEILEGGLPPRRERPAEPWALPQPYVCGDFVREDSAFYGRRFELMELEQALALASGPQAESGGAIFVTGPLKTGKTSLVKRFLRDLDQRRLPASVGVFCKAQVGEAWTDVERRLAARLAEEAERFAVREGGSLPRRLADDSEEMLRQIRGSLAAPPVVLVVDEALRPLRQAHRAAVAGDRDQLEALLRFRDLVERSPGTLLVLVGPEAPVRHLHPELSRTLRGVDTVRLQPFDQADTWALLQAEKMAWRYPIEVKRGLAKAVTSLTGGNPFWIASLAYLMYRRESRRPVRPIRYGHSALREAAEELIHHGGPFEDRLFPDGDSSQGPSWIWDLAHLLAVDPESGAGRDPGWTADELAVALEEAGVALAPGGVSLALDDLAALGGLARVPGKGDRFRLVAPLLAWFIRNEFELRRHDDGQETTP